MQDITGLKKVKNPKCLNDELLNFVLSENKYGLHYLLRMINFKEFGYTYEESYTKNELRNLL